MRIILILTGLIALILTEVKSDYTFDLIDVNEASCRNIAGAIFDFEVKIGPDILSSVFPDVGKFAQKFKPKARKRRSPENKKNEPIRKRRDLEIVRPLLFLLGGLFALIPKALLLLIGDLLSNAIRMYMNPYTQNLMMTLGVILSNLEVCGNFALKYLIWWFNVLRKLLIDQISAFLEIDKAILERYTDFLPKA